MIFSKEITGEEERIPGDHGIGYGDNRDHASVETVAKINNVLFSDNVHSFAKQVLRLGLTLDGVDAVYDLMLVLECLEAVLNDSLRE